VTKKTIKPVNPFSVQPLFNFSLRTKYILLAIIGFIFYANSIPNKYAFDDRGIVLDNTYVQMGISGIPKILTSDSWASYFSHMGGDPSSTQLSGGRFRPLSEIIFALEHQLFGNSALLPYFHHLVNVLAYLACILIIFYFLDNFLLKKLSGGSDIAFLSTLLFTIHPLHTEVVANIKSLDEILSLLFIMLTFIYSLKYLKRKQTKHLIIGTASFLLALLSKEYAITLLFFIPFLFYLLEDKKPTAAIRTSLTYYGIFIVYLLLRFNAVGFYHSNFQSANVSSNPYYYASEAQKIATEWLVLGKYLTLMFFPYPLSYDYSYNQIPYHSFSDITVLLSILIYTGVFIWGIKLALRKNVLSFAVFFFLLTILMISNFAIDIGATMGERLAFHSSLGFVVILSYCLLKAISNMKFQTKRIVVTGSILVIGIVCFGETIARNTQWKDDTSLYIHDVNVAPNSCLVNDNAGWSYLGLSQRKRNTAEQTKAYLDSAHKYLSRALQLNPKYYIAYNNLGDVYLSQGLLDSAQYCYDMVEKMNPFHPELKSNYAQLYFDKGLRLAMRTGKPREGIGYMRKALLLDSANADIWYNMAIAYYHMQQYDSAKYALLKTLQYKPDSTDATNAKKDLQALSEMKIQ